MLSDRTPAESCFGFTALSSWRIIFTTQTTSLQLPLPVENREELRLSSFSHWKEGKNFHKGLSYEISGPGAPFGEQRIPVRSHWPSPGSRGPSWGHQGNLCAVPCRDWLLVEAPPCSWMICSQAQACVGEVLRATTALAGAGARAALACGSCKAQLLMAWPFAVSGALIPSCLE